MSSALPLTVEIVSPGVPCGATYLLNILLELKLPVHTGGFNLFWRRTESGDWRPNPVLQAKFGLWLPGLAKQRFQFDAGVPTVAWHHLWPYPQALGTKRVLFIRDPRDALYSQYKRLRLKLPISLFLTEPSTPLGLSRIQKFMLQIRLWRALSRSEDLLLVRFEDIKLDPEGAVRQILAFLSIERNDREILDAIDASTTEAAKRNQEERMAGAGLSGQYSQMIRKGKVFEWQESLSRDDLPCYKAEYCESFLRDFGYPPAADVSASPRRVPMESPLLEANVRAVWRELYGSDRADSKMRQDAFVEISAICSGSHGGRVPVFGGIRLLSERRRSAIRVAVLAFCVRLATPFKLLAARYAPALDRQFDKLLYLWPLGER